MNPLLRWLTSPEWTHVVGALLHSLWQGAIIAIALAVLMRRLVNPVTRYRSALGALGMLVIASIVTWAVLNVPKPAAPVATPVPAAKSGIASTPTGALNLNSTDKVVVIGKMSSPVAPTNWTAWLALAWIVGALAMLLRAGVKVAGAESLRRSCKPLDDEHMISLVAEACRAVALARRIRVAVTDKLTSPAVVGVLVPTLILPLSLFSTLTPEQIRFVLLHELAHIRRGDYLANLFQLFAEALLFFNPAVWWISHQIRREREACCDALAIELSGAPVDYARTLLHVAETVLNPPPAAAPAFSDNPREPSSLTDRVQRLLVPGYRPALRLTWRAMLAAIVVGGTLLFLSAVGARNVVGAVSTNSSETTTKPVTNVVVGLPIAPDLYKSSEDIDGSKTNATPATNQLIITRPPPNRGRGRASISNKLEQITFDRISFDHQPWTNVIKTVSDRARKLDPDKRGVNLIVNPNTAETAPTANAQPASTPLLPPLVFISVVPELTNASLRQVLDAIVKGADKPITYQLEEYAVVFSLKESEIESLETRLFHIPTDVVYEKILTNFTHTKLGQPIGGLERTNRLQAMRDRFSEWIQHRGVNIDPTRGKAVFYNEEVSEGMLFVRATKSELDTIEATVRDACIRPPQVNIKIRWVEIPQSVAFDLFRPNLTNTSLPPILRSLDPSIARLRNMSGILSETQMAEIKKRIERRDGIELLSEGQVTTLTERQAQISVSEIKTIVTGISTNKNASVEPEVQPVPLGPVFDVLPTVTSDGASIRLEVISTFIEFVGYDTNTAQQFVPTIVNGETNSAMLPLPIFHVKQVTHDAIVPDGRTLILGNLTTTEIAKQPNGEYKTADVTSTQTNLLFILVTPTIIDPAGNPASSARKNSPVNSLTSPANINR